MTDSPHVAIVIPIYNGVQDTLECLDSLTGIDYPACSIIIVDNGSADGSAEAIEAWQHENQCPLTLIRNERNLGFTGGCNVGIRHGLAHEADYILLLNNDTVVTPDFLSILVSAAEENPQIGIVGPKIYQYNTDRILDSAGISAIIPLGQPFLRGHGLPDQGQFDEQEDAPYVTGCALLIKSPVIERIGLLDEDYISYFEDFDWGLRAVRSGYRCLYVPRSVIHHKGSQTTQFESPVYYFFHTRNRIIFARKHVAWIPFLFFFLPYFVLYRYLRPACRLLYHRRWDHWHSLHKGLKEGFTIPLTVPDRPEQRRNQDR